MISQLKRRFVSILMFMVSLLLCFSLLLNYVTSALSLEAETTKTLFELAQTDHIQDPWNLYQVALPFFAIEVHHTGQIIAVWDEYYQLSEAQLLGIAEEISSENKISGTLSSYNVRYVCIDVEEGIRIVCSDVSLETQILEQLFHTSLLVSAVSLCLLFILALILAKTMLKPVEEAWERQQQFVADASHELKTPLTVILSSAEMLSEELPCTDSVQGRRWLSNITEEGQRMKRLMEDMLTLTRSPEELVKEWIDFSELVERVVMRFEPVAFEKSLFLVDQLDEGISFLGDRDRLQQLLSILLDNAVKYSASSGEINVTLLQGKELVLRVQNASLPLTEQECARLFDRFYRQDASRAEQEGYGLGLPIALEIVKGHGGEIVSSYSDGIFTMEVRFPAMPINPSK